jgi:hypothetical protein
VSTEAYERASAGRPGVLARYEEVRKRLKAAGQSGSLRGFLAILSRGKASINMPIPKLVRFIEEGGYLSIYEFVARETGLADEDLERAVQERLGEFGPLRLKLDQTFHFGSDTHYAAFNLGGAGALRFGCCCAVFDLRHWAPHFTCYGGDSIRACCDAEKNLMLGEEEILEKFSVGEDLEKLAAIRWERSLNRLGPGVDPAWVRDILEAEDSLLEVHLHGPVTRDRIQEIRLRRRDYNHLCALADRASGLTGPVPWELDNVEPFRELLALLDRFEIPLVLAEI